MPCAQVVFAVFDDGQRFPLWEDWLVIEANHPDLPINVSMEFASLELAIQAKNSVGIAVWTVTMIEYELCRQSCADFCGNSPRGFGLRYQMSTNQKGVQWSYFVVKKC